MLIMLAGIMGISMIVAYWQGYRHGKRHMARVVMRQLDSTIVHYPCSRSEGAD